MDTRWCSGEQAAVMGVSSQSVQVLLIAMHVDTAVVIYLWMDLVAGELYAVSAHGCLYGSPLDQTYSVCHLEIQHNQ